MIESIPCFKHILVNVKVLTVHSLSYMRVPYQPMATWDAVLQQACPIMFLDFAVKCLALKLNLCCTAPRSCSAVI